MTIEEDIAQRIDKALDGDCGYGVGEHLAAVVMPLVKRAQAEALREAALDARRFVSTREAGAWLDNRADRIESEGASDD